MGLFINLFVNSCNISTEQWQSVYDESLVLLQHFPAKLSRFDTEIINGQKRYHYTTELIMYKGAPNEKWQVDGDIVSDKHAESFSLPRHLNARYAKEDARDVLWVRDDSLHYIGGYGYELFDRKTQGYPYHLAILAVGILVESRFSGKAYVTGDINTEQAEMMTSWCNTILNKTVEKPVCCVAQRLFQRLNKIYSDDRLLIERFTTLSMDNETHVLSALFQLSNRTLVLNKIEDRLGQFQSLTQFGAINIVGQLLESQSDVKLLIEMVSSIIADVGEKKSVDFSVESLLTLLVRYMITIKKESRDTYTQLADNMSRTGDINHTMGKVLSRLMGFSPSYFDFYISSEELLDIFCAYDAEKCGDFEKIITHSELWCQEQIKEYNDIVNEVEKTMPQQEKLSDKPLHSLASIEKSEQNLFNFSFIKTEMDLNSLFSDQEQYILDDIYRQKVIFNDPVKLVCNFGNNIQRLIKENHKQMQFDTIEEGLLLLYKASVDNGIVLKEPIWIKIDTITNLKLLQNLVVLAFINNISADMCQLRIFILEHPDFWEELNSGD